MRRFRYALTLTLATLPAVAVPQTLLPAMPSLLPVPAAAARPAVDHGPTVIEQASDGLFYVQASVNGTPIQFVVDSGSSLVILNGRDAARAGVGAGVGSGADVAVETAGGAASMKRARIKHVVFAGQTLNGVDAVVVDKNLKVSLLGQSALSQLGSVTFKGNRLELR